MTDTQTTEVHQLPGSYGIEILRSEVGSTLHGTGLPGGEDRDEMGMFVEHPNSVFGLETVSQYEWRSAREREPVTAGRSPKSGPGDTDLVVYSLRKWCALAAKGNPSVLLPLFAPVDKLVIRSELGHALRANTDWFVSQRCGRAFLGYMERQRQRMTGQRGKAGRVREAGGEVDWKYAMHMVRLGYQGCEIMQHGRLTLPIRGPVGVILRRIRRGEVSLGAVLQLAEGLEGELTARLQDAYLPPEPNTTAINDFLVDAHLQTWGLV